MTDYNLYSLGYSKSIIKYKPVENQEMTNSFEGGLSLSSIQENPRVEISPDSVIGLRIIDDNNNDVFKALVGGTDVGDVIIGNYSGGQGLLYDKSQNKTTFAGELSAATGTLGSIVVVGNFTLGTTTVSISNTDGLQDTIDAMNAIGGGTIILQPGYYVVDSDIVLYSHIILKGQRPQNTFIHFAGEAHSLKIKGTLVYDTGTVSIPDGSTTVTGSGTTWVGNVSVGDAILLGESDWFVITEVTNNTSLEIENYYYGRDLSAGVTYKIAKVKDNVSMDNLTIIGSTTHGIDAQYTNNLKLFNVMSGYHGGDALRIDGTNWNILDYLVLAYSARGIYANDTYNSSFDRFFVPSNTGTGLVYEGGSQDNSFRFLKLYGNNIGAEIKDSNNSTFTRVDARHNTLQGIVFDGGNHISIDAISTVNGSDGIKLQGNSDNILINGCLITDNGGYGVNVSAATCDHTLIDSSQFADNTSGALNDAGTDTKIGTNIGIPSTIVYRSVAAEDEAGIKGTICWDDSYIYICVDTDEWKRVEIATWI